MIKSNNRARAPEVSPTTDGSSASPTAASATSSKREQVVAMLLRDEGATLDQLIAVTGWLPHTARAALSGLRKAGYGIDSDKVDGLRTYRAVVQQ